MKNQASLPGSEKKPIKVLHCSDVTIDLRNPVVMGILNITPDSFFDGGSYMTLSAQLLQTEKMLSEGASVIDIGAVSTRPGADQVTVKEEVKRLIPSLKELKHHFPEAVFSVDTSSGEVAQAAIDFGAGMINDISGGRFDKKMIPMVTRSAVPFIIMHMQGSPTDMQNNPVYKDVVTEVNDFFREQIGIFPDGYSQIVLDPGFGFGKTIAHNFLMLSSLKSFTEFGFPLMVGISRKSMIYRILQNQPSESLNGTTVLNTVALIQGADILRVHDVKEAMEAVKLLKELSL